MLSCWAVAGILCPHPDKYAKICAETSLSSTLPRGHRAVMDGFSHDATALCKINANLPIPGKSAEDMDPRKEYVKRIGAFLQAAQMEKELTGLARSFWRLSKDSPAGTDGQSREGTGVRPLRGLQY